MNIDDAYGLLWKFCERVLYAVCDGVCSTLNKMFTYLSRLRYAVNAGYTGYAGVYAGRAVVSRVSRVSELRRRIPQCENSLRQSATTAEIARHYWLKHVSCRPLKGKKASSLDIAPLTILTSGTLQPRKWQLTGNDFSTAAHAVAAQNPR